MRHVCCWKKHTIIQCVDNERWWSRAIAFRVISEYLQLVRRSGLQVADRVLEYRIAYFDFLHGFRLLLNKIVVDLTVWLEVDDLITTYQAVFFVALRRLPFDIERRARHFAYAYVLRCTRNCQIWKFLEVNFFVSFFCFNLNERHANDGFSSQLAKHPGMNHGLKADILRSAALMIQVFGEFTLQFRLLWIVV